jgi:hypothetical protein
MCNFASKFVISERARFFYMPQSWDIYLVKKIYKMGCLEGSGVPVLYIGRTVLKV